MMARSARDPLAAVIVALRRHLAFAGGFSLFLNLLYLAPTLYMLQVYDRVVPTRGHLTLLFITLALLLALVTLSLLDLVRSRLLVRAGVRLEKTLAPAVLDAGFARTGGRDLAISRSTRDLDVLRQVITGPAVLALFDAPWSPIYIAVSFLIHPLLGALSLVGAVMLTGLALLNEQVTRQSLRLANEAANLSYLSQQHSTAHADMIRALGMRRAMVRRHLTERDIAAELQLRANFAASSLTTVSRFLRIAFQSLALGAGAWLAIDQQVSAGAIFAASLLIGRALSPIEQLLGAWRSLAQGRDAYRNLKELVAGEAAAPPRTELPPPTGALRIEGVSVAGPAGGPAILADVSFQVQPGEIIGIVGASGAGKSTLIRVIGGAARADRGVVRFDGADANQWDPEALARHIGFMPQDTALFAGTIKQNIARFSDLVGDADVDALAIEAATLAGAHDLIVRLPKGYDAELGWAGRGLSSGHAQRIALARALFGRPRIVLLDEPNAHLDAEGSQALGEALRELRRRGATVMVVAHRTDILGGVDKLMVMRDGRIEQFGPRDDVAARLNAMQAERPGPRPLAAGGASR
jgi:ATP-binding cassette subfamily C protein